MVEDRAGMKMSWVANGALRLIYGAFYEDHPPPPPPAAPNSLALQPGPSGHGQAGGNSHGVPGDHKTPYPPLIGHRFFQ
jgi:hypothetical protein